MLDSALVSETSPDPKDRKAATGPERTCDFCGRSVPRVLRVALDRDYDRLAKAHAVRYACPDCSVKKDEERRGGG